MQPVAEKLSISFWCAIIHTNTADTTNLTQDSSTSNTSSLQHPLTPPLSELEGGVASTAFSPLVKQRQGRSSSVFPNANHFRRNRSLPSLQENQDIMKLAGTIHLAVLGFFIARGSGAPTSNEGTLTGVQKIPQLPTNMTDVEAILSSY